jgi:hypothetical protein
MGHSNFKILPPARMLIGYPWQLWAVGWLAIFKGILWLAYEPNLPDAQLTVLGYKYLIGMLPFLICGFGVWNLRRWAVWGLIALSVLDLAFLLLNLHFFNSFYVHSEVKLYSIILTSIVLLCNGPVGDILILIAVPVLFKHTRKA